MKIVIGVDAKRAGEGAWDWIRKEDVLVCSITKVIHLDV
jgi:hypothetical protein